MKKFMHYAWQTTAVVCSLGGFLFTGATVYVALAMKAVNDNAELLFPAASKVTLVDDSDKVIYEGTREDSEQWAREHPELRSFSEMRFTLGKTGESSVWARACSGDITTADLCFDDLRVTLVAGGEALPATGLSGLKILKAFGKAEKVEGVILVQHDTVVAGSYITIE